MLISGRLSKPFFILTLILSFLSLHSLPAIADGSISGKVTIQNRSDHSALITFKLKIPGQTIPIQTSEITTTPDGSYQLDNIPAGIYNLSAKASNSLSQNYVLIEVAEGQDTPNIDFSLLGGDANNDNSVASGDMAIVRNAWLSNPETPNWDERADFNGDGSIGTGDFLILRNNWFKNGFEPIVSITSPEDNSITTASPITVSGTVDNNISTVTVKGLNAVIDNGSFTAENIALSSGLNTISAIAVNATGNINADLISVSYDPETLSITITSPQNNASFSASPITVEGTVSDNSAMVTVRNKSAVVTDNTFSASVVITASITPIIARAQLGQKTASDRIDVYLDTAPPAITILTPDENAVTRSSVVYGRVSEDTAFVIVNSTPAELIDTYFIAEPVLTEGENTITVEARDELGNTSQITHTFTFTPDSDKVIISSPLHNSTTDTSPITVTGIVTSDITYLSVDSFSLSTALIEENSFTADGVRLQPVKSVVTATGPDELDVKHQDAIILHTPEIQHYELTKVSGDIQEGGEDLPPAGSEWELKLKVYSNNRPVVSETVEFTITQGGGALSSQYGLSDPEGEITITLTTDTDASITNIIEAKVSNCPEVKTAFSVDTKPGLPATLTKITDESITPVPGAVIPLIVKLTDQYNNPITEETINFQITQGTGTLSSPTANTTYYGEAQVNLICPPTPETLTQITASSAIEPSVTVSFNITTSEAITVTVEDLFNAVDFNAQKIEDQIVEMTVTSDDPDRPEIVQYKVWQKGDLMKVQGMSTSEIYIRPQLTIGTTSSADTRIISYDPGTGIYIVKTKAAGQIEEKPYTLTYIDYFKGVITKIESYDETAGLSTIYSTAMLNFIQLPETENAWAYNVKTERLDSEGEIVYTTTVTVTDRQVNTGLTEADFQ